MPDTIVSEKPKGTNDRVSRIGRSIAHALAKASAGERSETRRMMDGCPFFWRIAAQMDLPEKEHDKWLRYTRMAALLTPASANDSFDAHDRPLGAVLADGGRDSDKLESRPSISEQRLARLLSARGTSQLDALERTIRMIASKTRKLSAEDLAKAVIYGDTMRIAKAYYRRLDATASKNSKETKND